ncbi:hypothetical protein [Nocardioides daphniae]|uniref:Uncharacterized protein n=1 Tax=Nocardioides daphniae TaxID=402297 RepID=A0A4P7UCX3_9ACTN|nr:hypothetical protein [Nocardioides daphniae]QCC77225.1 hypothetical protein E2C04_08460 [Nocardioides daphniae]GGD26483.1 hypothetical protein GCM10007231_27370 [Nocardioides daphniae]
MNQWSTTVVAGVAALAVALLLVALVLLLRSQRRTRGELAQTRAAQAELLARLDALDRPAAGVHADPRVAEFVITELGEEDAGPGTGAEQPAPVAGRIDGRLFVDIVARESLVKAASWTYGVRRALSAENRNRVRFEVRRETRRAARQRKADVKEALRQYYAKERGDVA